MVKKSISDDIYGPLGFSTNKATSRRSVDGLEKFVYSVICLIGILTYVISGFDMRFSPFASEKL